VIRARVCLPLLLAATCWAQDPPPPPPPAGEAEPAVETAPAKAPPPVTALPISIGVAGIATSWFVPIRAELVSETALAARVDLVSESGLVLHEFGEVSFAAGQTHRLRTLLSASKLERHDKLALRLTPSSGGAPWTTGESSVLAVWSGLFLVLDKHGALPADLTNLRPTYEPATLSQAARLPEHSMAYAGVSAVLLGDLALESWSDAQARALATWVKRGGHLLISVGPRARALRRSPLGKHLSDAALGALPDAAPESGPLPRESLDALSSGLPADAPGLAAAAPLGWARLLRGPRDVSLDAGGTHLVATRRVGRGVIDLIAVDLWSEPFQFAPQTELLLRKRLDWNTDGGFRSRSELLKPALTLIPPPSSLGPVFAMLIAFAMIAGPGVYFLLRGKKRGIWLWVAIPGLTLTCTLCMPIYRLSLNDAESTLVGVSLIEQRQGEAEAVETVDLLVFSGGLDDKRVEFEGQDPTLIGVTPTGYHFLGDAPETLSVDLPVALWGARYVSLETTRKALDLQATIEYPVWEPPVLVLETGSVPRIQELWVVLPGPNGPRVHHHPEPIVSNSQLRLELELTPYQTQQTTTPHNTLLNSLIQRLCGEQLRADRGFVIVEFVNRLGVRVQPNVLPRDTWSFAVVDVPREFTQGFPLNFGGAPMQTERRSLDVAGIDSSLEVREVAYTVRCPKAPLRLNLLLGVDRLPEIDAQLEGYLPAKDEWVVLGPAVPNDENPRDNRIDLRYDTPGLDPRELFDPETKTIRMRQRSTLARGVNYRGRWIRDVDVVLLVWDPAAVDMPTPREGE